jgi:serine/threonine protein kinase
MSPEVLKE